MTTPSISKWLICNVISTVAIAITKWQLTQEAHSHRTKGEKVEEKRKTSKTIFAFAYAQCEWNLNAPCCSRPQCFINVYDCDRFQYHKQFNTTKDVPLSHM